MRAEAPCTCIIEHPCIPLIFYLMTFNIRFYQSFQTNLKHKGWELYFRGQRMVPCECSIEKHGTDAGQSFYVNIYNVIHQNIFVHCRERCGSQQSFFHRRRSVGLRVRGILEKVISCEDKSRSSSKINVT